MPKNTLKSAILFDLVCQENPEPFAFQELLIFSKKVQKGA
jgi:hypothetical protein